MVRTTAMNSSFFNGLGMPDKEKVREGRTVRDLPELIRRHLLSLITLLGTCLCKSCWFNFEIPSCAVFCRWEISDIGRKESQITEAATLTRWILIPLCLHLGPRLLQDRILFLVACSLSEKIELKVHTLFVILILHYVHALVLNLLTLMTISRFV